MLVLAEEEPLCSDAMCSDEQLTSNLSPDIFALEPLGSGISYDLNTGDLTNTSRAFNVTCADGWVPAGSIYSTIVTCEDRSSYSNFDANETLMCVPYVYDSDWCSASVWADSVDGEWLSGSNWVGESEPSKYDMAVIGGDTDFTVSLDGVGAASSLTIEDGGAAVLLEIGGGEGSVLVLAEEDALCSTGFCEDDQLLDAIPDEGYNVTALGSGMALDMNTGDLSIAHRSYSISCADGYVSAIDIASTEATCKNHHSFSVFNVETELLCIPEPGDYCPIAVWENANDGSWNEKSKWTAKQSPTMFDAAVLSGSDSEYTVSLNGDGEASSLTIGEGSASVVLEIGSSEEDGGMLILAESYIDTCREYLCDAADLWVPDHYILSPLGSSLYMDDNTNE